MAGLFSPALLAVHAFEEHLVVLLGGHGHGRVANPAICGAPVLVRPCGPLVRANRGYFTVSCYLNPFHRRKCRRIDPLDLCAQLLNRPLAPRLAQHVSFRSDA